VGPFPTLNDHRTRAVAGCVVRLTRQRCRFWTLDAPNLEIESPGGLSGRWRPFGAVTSIVKIGENQEIRKSGNPHRCEVQRTPINRWAGRSWNEGPAGRAASEHLRPERRHGGQTAPAVSSSKTPQGRTKRTIGPSRDLKPRCVELEFAEVDGALVSCSKGAQRSQRSQRSTFA
jgi:hypothetical protein